MATCALLALTQSCSFFGPSQRVDGTLTDTDYTAPDGSFSVAVPFVALHDRRWMEVDERDLGNQLSITFGPAAMNYSVYRLNVMRRTPEPPPEDLRSIVEKIAGNIVPYLEQQSGTEMRMVEDKATEIDGKKAWFRRYEQPLKPANGQPRTVHHRWVLVSHDGRTWSAWRQWLDDGRPTSRNGNLSVEQFAASVRLLEPTPQRAPR